jgi:hypothetical protein
MTAVSEEQPGAVPTVRDRLVSAGLSADRIERHLQTGRIAVDGEPVEDLDAPAAPPSRVTILGS